MYTQEEFVSRLKDILFREFPEIMSIKHEYHKLVYKYGNKYYISVEGNQDLEQQLCIKSATSLDFSDQTELIEYGCSLCIFDDLPYDFLDFCCYQSIQDAMDRYGGLDSLKFTSISKSELMGYITSFVSGQDKLNKISEQIGIPADVKLMRGDGNGYLFLLIDCRGRFMNIMTYGS